LTCEPRELTDADEAVDLIHGALAHLIDTAANRVLVVDRQNLHWDWTRKLRIEICDEVVKFSFPDDSAARVQ
jgi:hypothetical protein